MAKATRNLMAVVATGVVLFAANPAVAAEPHQTRIVLRVCDSWQLQPASLARVQAEVAAIYDRIGIDVVWTAPDGSKNDAHNLTVVILSRERGLKLIAAADVKEGVMGQAVNAAGYAYIFTHRVEDTASRRGINFDRLLGKVIAHEVGHLLLTNAHSELGIMKAAMQVQTNASEWFTSTQGVTIRAALAVAANQN